MVLVSLVFRFAGRSFDERLYPSVRRFASQTITDSENIFGGLNRVSNSGARLDQEPVPLRSVGFPTGETRRPESRRYCGGDQVSFVLMGASRKAWDTK